jgi:intracellular sulfur oxidation DsrE/DsrF family protein
MKISVVSVAGCLLAVSLLIPAGAQQTSASGTIAEYPGDRMTLGDARSLKGVFSVTGRDAAAVAANLAGVRDIATQLRKQGVAPELAIVFMGPSVRQLVRSTQSAEIADVLAQLRNQKVELNVCSIAMGIERVEPSQLADGLRIVGDGLIAVLAYQQRGYGYAPPF